MSQEVKNCSNCQKIIQFVKKGDKYYRLEEINGVIVEKTENICPTCWESKKDDYKKQLKEKISKGKAGVSKITKGLAHYDGGETSHQFSLHICQNCDKWQEEGEENLHLNCKEDNPRERERESNSSVISNSITLNPSNLKITN